MDDFLGNIQLFPYDFIPMNYLACDGASLPINGPANALYNLIGTTYGGNGSTNFNLPNMKGEEPIPGLTYCICESGYWPPRD
ncbi:MAG: tail fiber protein [Syntrophomonadaceae bacterium]|nr:tail fiber protein [Syntrophomonadaceae bacterium]